MKHFIGAFKKFADFSGRAQREEYWMFILFYLIFYIILMTIDIMAGTAVLAAIFSLVMLVPSISVAARRLHDTGRTGWWQLIILLPLIGAIVLLVFLVQDSHDENAYGPNPKAA